MATLTKNPIAIAEERVGGKIMRSDTNIMKNIVTSTLAKNEAKRQNAWNEFFKIYSNTFDEMGLVEPQKQYVWLKQKISDSWNHLGFSDKEFQDYVLAMPRGVVQEVNPLFEVGVVKKTPKPPSYPKLKGSAGGAGGGAAGGAPSGTGRRNRKQTRKSRKNRKSRRATRRQ